MVDKLSGKLYMGQGYVFGGTQVVRIDANGNYDNYISTANPNYEEIWDLRLDCIVGNILCFGGGTTTNTNLAVLTPAGIFTTQNVTGNASGFQDIVYSTASPSGEIFAAMACGIDPTLNNTLMRVNPTFNGNLWFVSSGLTSFSEADNKPYLSAVPSNGFNALSANYNYLYYYDGSVLKAFNKSTGASVGNIYTVVGNVLKFQGGNYEHF